MEVKGDPQTASPVQEDNLRGESSEPILLRIEEKCETLERTQPS